MPTIVPGYEYDIFISYRQKDNKVDGWVTGFVSALRAELDATLKNPVSIYFDENPHDGLLETHQVNASLDKKLKCIVFIPIVSQTYCDPGSYAWQYEFQKFIEIASSDRLGLQITLVNGNVASRVLPIQINELDPEDRRVIESALGGPMRGVPFIYSAPGVNRPLRLQEEHPENNLNRTSYRDQINKVANALKDIGTAVVQRERTGFGGSEKQEPGEVEDEPKQLSWRKVNLVAAAVLILTVASYYFFKGGGEVLDASKASIAVIPFRNNTGDPSMSHYGVGIASEVSTQLGLTKQFDFVSSLQATIQYQQSDKSPTEIGDDLGVTHILTGMYQTAGDNMNVLVELVDASGKVIWSIPYKTRYTDIFDVQRRIALQVKEKFAIKGAEEPAVTAPNMEAYAHLIKGVEIVLKSNRPEDRMKAVAEYQQAIELDSGFIEPWWRIIQEYCYYYWNRGEQEELTLEMIQPYMEYVQEHFPDDWKKKALMGTYEYWALAHYQKGLDLFLESLEEAPQDGGVHSMVAAIYRRQLQLNEALKHLSVSLKQNPGAVIYWSELIALAQINGDYESAVKAAATVYDLNNTLSGNLYRLRLWTRTLDQLPEAVKKQRGIRYQADQLLLIQDYAGVIKLASAAPDGAMSTAGRLYYRIVGNYLLGRDNQVGRLAAEYLKLDDQNIEQRLTVMGLLRREKDFHANSRFQGRSMEDLSEQWNLETDTLTYQILSGRYAEADKKLKEINRKYPQVGDYAWLNQPIFQRIQSEYPAFKHTMNQMKLPPRIMDNQLIRL